MISWKPKSRKLGSGIYMLILVAKCDETEGKVE